MSGSHSIHDRTPVPDGENKEMAELLGGDVMAYRIARRLRREGITDLASLRGQYEEPVWGANVAKGHALLDIDRLGNMALERIAAALEVGQTGTTHHHRAGDECPDPVILCGTAPAPEGVRWYHLPVNGHFWHHCTGEERDRLRSRVREALGDASAVIHVFEATPRTSAGPVRPNEEQTP